MLFVLFQLREDRYALAAGGVTEILPLARLKQIPQAPAGVAGVFSLRGTPVPAIDLSLLLLGRPARAMHSTRIILVRYPDRHGIARPLGLVAERATEMLRRDPADFTDPGVRSDGAPYLGPVTQDAQGLVQWIAVDKLLTPGVRDALFQRDVTP